MRNIIFAKAGTYKDSDDVFFTSRCRKKNLSYGIYHRNKYTTEFLLPQNVFKKHFTFDRSAGVYRNLLTYGQLRVIPGVKVSVIDHEPYL